jgi:hypothetical protein
VGFKKISSAKALSGRVSNQDILMDWQMNRNPTGFNLYNSPDLK